MAEKTNTEKSNAEQVKDFTEQSMGVALPDRPKPISLEQMVFINEMVISELIEGNRDTPGVDTWKAARDMVINAVFADMLRKETRANGNLPEPPNDIDEVDVISSQADALVDAIYYILNLTAKNGINIQPIFDIIQGANMDKKDPEKGWIKSPDGKVLKREGWTAPNIRAEIERQLKDGAW